MTPFESHASREFWDLYERPRGGPPAGDEQFILFQQDPSHPSLHLKPVGAFWSARVTEAYRALAVREANVFYWFWIGSHEQYKRLIG